MAIDLADSIALTTLATVKDELGITATTWDEALKRRILVASEAIAGHCNRTFRRAEVTETLRPSGAQVIVLSRTPVVEIASITEGGRTIAASEYVLQNAAAGMVFRDAGWPARQPWLVGVSLTPIPGTGAADIEVTYTGGYVLPNDTSGTRDLPHDLEQACIETVKSLHLGAGRDRLVVGESLGAASVTYAGVNTATGRGAGGIIPDEVLPQLAKYVRAVVL